jgi:hypothetical protein
VNPIEITAKAWKCAKCGVARYDKYIATQCCAPCVYCGADFRSPHDRLGGWMACRPCRDKHDRAREQERFEAAEKISWRDCKHGFFDGDNYYACAVEWWEAWECDHDEGDELPEYLWGAEQMGPALDVDHLLDCIYDERGGDYEIDGVEALSKAIDALNAAQPPWFEETWKTAVLLEGLAEEMGE